MPEYINSTKREITFTVDGESITLLPKQSIKTAKLYTDVEGLEEVSPFPNLTPIVKEDIVLGDQDEEVIIDIVDIAKKIRIINRSGVDIVLYFNSSDTQGMTIINLTGVTIDIIDDMKYDVKKLVIKLFDEVTMERGIIVSQYRM